MNIVSILNTDANVQLVINASDLREYSLSLIDDVLSKKEEREPEEHYLTTNAAAKRLDVDISTLWRYAKCDYLVPIKVGGKKRYRESDIKRIEEGK